MNRNNIRRVENLARAQLERPHEIFKCRNDAPNGKLVGILFDGAGIVEIGKDTIGFGPFEKVGYFYDGREDLMPLSVGCKYEVREAKRRKGISYELKSLGGGYFFEKI